MGSRYSVLIAGLSLAFSAINPSLKAQEHSLARQWNERMLAAIRRDFARPPVQARNLYQISAAMYEAWAAYDPKAEPFLLGRTRAGYTCPFDGLPIPQDIEAARREAMSFAAYRMIVHRYQNSPGVFLTMLEVNDLMNTLGYDIGNTSYDYLQGGPAELGNYIASQIIAYGMQDGSMEQFNFSNQYYSPVNIPMVVADPGNPNMADPNRWQQLTLTVAIDQQGNPVPSTAPFQSPEWGNVDPFGLDPSQMIENERDGHFYKVYLDPGAPAYLDTNSLMGLESFYKWNFCMVPIWQSHMDPDDGVMIDISPASKGNIQSYPQTEQELRDFYDYFEGGDVSTGHAMNPITGEPYTPQIVKRGDYARILAEFWADGPNSETPPGHWFSIMHTAMDHPLFERKWMGEGEELEELEYDVKAHLVLGGALHDAAITAWGIKGWYDYVRPISAVRYMATKGQCSDPMLPNHHPAGLPIIPGHMEMVLQGDELAGDNNEHVGKMKLHTWRGPDYVDDPDSSAAGVGWILAENWFPYQRPTFVTPPFAGYISGHSTFSRTAAEVLTSITGDPFFPGGMSNFLAPQNNFLVFEQGPTQDIYLQWATYRDASDQCSLSRIWGGIHPPIDDIPGRHLGMIIGPSAVNEGNSLFNSERPIVVSVTATDPVLNISDIGGQFHVDIVYDQPMDASVEPIIDMMIEDPLYEALTFIGGEWITQENYRLTYELLDVQTTLRNIHLRIDSALAMNGHTQNVHLGVKPFIIDTERPVVSSINSSAVLVNDQLASQGTLTISVEFNEACDQSVAPQISWNAPSDLSNTFILDGSASGWISGTVYHAIYQVVDNNEEVVDIDIAVDGATDMALNPQESTGLSDILVIDTREPLVQIAVANTELLNMNDVGQQALILNFTFDEAMDINGSPVIEFLNGEPIGTSLIIDVANSMWLDQYTFQQTYELVNVSEEFNSLGVAINNAHDLAGNVASPALPELTITIDTKMPEMLLAAPSVNVIADAQVGMAGLSVALQFSEEMDQGSIPTMIFDAASDISGSLIHETDMDTWTSGTTFVAYFNVVDEGIEVSNIGVSTSGARDLAGNDQAADQGMDILHLDTRNPELLVISANTYDITDAHIGSGTLQIISLFDEAMASGALPLIGFSEPVDQVLALDPSASSWLNASTYRSIYDVAGVETDLDGLTLLISNAKDVVGNPIEVQSFLNYLSINIILSSVNEHTTLEGLWLFPNPLLSGSTLWLRLQEHHTDPYLKLMDANGRIVHEVAFMNNMSGSIPIELPSLASGTYTALIGTGDAVIHRRLVVLDGMR